MSVAPWSQGDLCSVESEGGYGIAKVLKVEGDVVHVRLYANRFATRPDDVDLDTLTLGTIHDQLFGIGHVPLDVHEFQSWAPEVITNEPVDSEELEGYNIWREAAAEGTAGVWGTERRSFGAFLRRPFRRRAT